MPHTLRFIPNSSIDRACRRPRSLDHRSPSSTNYALTPMPCPLSPTTLCDSPLTEQIHRVLEKRPDAVQIIKEFINELLAVESQAASEEHQA